MVGAIKTHNFMASIIVHHYRTTQTAHSIMAPLPVVFDMVIPLHIFKLIHIYQISKPRVKNKIIKIASNGANICNTAPALKISVNTTKLHQDKWPQKGSHMEILPLSVNLMSNELMLTANSIDISVGTSLIARKKRVVAYTFSLLNDEHAISC